MDGLRSRLSAKNLSISLAGLVLVTITHLPIAPTVLSLDNVNLAFAIQQFDPWMHQPQPPGYPFFVGESRLVDHFFHNAEKTFRFISIVVTWLAAVFAFLLARRLFGEAAGYVAALLLILNPTLWYSGLDSPLRPHLAFFSLAVAYLCWRAWTGEAHFGLWAALVLGLGGGFRPDLAFHMFPLWCVAMWKGQSSWKTWVRGVGILFAITTIWIGIAAYAVGGLDRYTLLMWVYSFSAMTESSSVLLNSTTLDWLYQIGHMIAWNAVGVLTWSWLIPVWFVVRKRTQTQSPKLWFFAAWMVPGMVVQGIVHVAAPGHTLFSVTATCILGAFVILATCRGVSARLAPHLIVVAAGLTAALNVLFFFNTIPIPILPATSAGAVGHIMSRALAEGAHQTTVDDLRASNRLSDSSVQGLKDLLRTSRPVIVVSTLGTPKHFHFLNFRIASYYIADRDFWIVADEESPPKASRIHGKDLLEIRYGSTVKVPFPRNARIIWLMDPDSPFRNAVSKAVHLDQDGNVFHSDIDSEVSSFRVQNFEFTVDDRILHDGTMVGNGSAGNVQTGNN